MSERDSKNKSVQRRHFLKTASVGALLPMAGTKASAAPNATARSTDAAKSQALIRSSVATSSELEADVVVVGGGMAGVCASIAAARNGATVALIQDRSVLGGNASSEVRMHICGADVHGSRTDTDARESGILEELRLEDAVRNPQRCANLFDLTLYEWVKREPNITLLLDTDCHGVEMSADDRIAAVHASRHGTEETFTIRAKVFVDSSGDGRLGAEAGADFRVGREAQAEYGESLAPKQADRFVLGSSILFITREHDRPMPFYAPYFIHRFPSCDDLPHRGHGSWEYGYWWVEWGGELDTIKDNEQIREELLAAALGVWDHIKNSGQHPTSENWALEWIGAIPGKRESRRFIGDHVLIEQEVKRGELFEDGVAYGGWGLDLHPPKGIYTKERPYRTERVPLYNIPFRSLYSRNISNLLFAGRNVSASHAAFGSTRVMATCSVMGQAVGTAAALCARHGCQLRELGRDGIEELQQTLLKDDAYIVGTTNLDPLDLARDAAVSASSEKPGHEAPLVTNGIARRVYKEHNHWSSDPGKGFPQHLDLRFKEAKRLREIYLTFDTGLNRQLTLTHSDGNNRHIIRAAQPETVSDYELQVISGESVKTIAKVSDNHQRRRIHRIEPTNADAVRLVVNAARGVDSARVFEIRAYE